MLLILSLCLVHDCMLFLFCPRGPASKARSVSVCRLICRRVVTSLLTWTSWSPMSLSTFWSYWWPLLLNRMHSVGVCDLSDSCPEGNSHRKRATLHDLNLSFIKQYFSMKRETCTGILFIYFSLHMNYIIECLCGRALSKQNNIYFLTDLTITELLYFLWSRIQFFKRISLTREWIQLKDFDYFAVSKEPSNERHGKYDISPDFVFFLWFLHQIRTKVRIILATVVYRTTFWSILLYLPVFWCHFAWAVILILLYYTWITFVYIILIPLCFFQQGNQK